MTRHPKNVKVSNIEILPHELVSEVLARVAASSSTDMFNAKLSCKLLNEIGEDTYVYRRVSLDKFPIVHWNPLSEKQQAFLEKCRQCENPEIMYRQAVLDYFNRTNVRSTSRNLVKALESGHPGALYVTCIVLLFSGDEESRQKGIRLVGEMTKTKSMRREVRRLRNNLIRVLKEMWVKNPVLKQRPICCRTRHQWKRGFEDDVEEDVKCEACRADREIGFMCNRYNY